MNLRHVFIDLEGLGRRATSAITQIGAIAFDPDTGETGAEFHRYVEVRDDEPFTVEIATVRWHAERGTWPHPPGTFEVPVRTALADLNEWLLDRRTFPDGIDFYWSWGSVYDFPIIEHAFNVCGPASEPPYFYWQVTDARSFWNRKFPGIKHDPRPHHALEDCRMGIKDLAAALQPLTVREAA